MLRPFLAVGSVVVISTMFACAHTPRSKWEEGGQYHVCKCHGTERAPSPSEASGFKDDESVDQYCEGTVSNCHIGKRSDPDSNNNPYGGPVRNQLD